ncbi:cyclic nucleotide-binding domain-containing protein [Ceratocystis lukuohia]|uniref:Cyclic nucleotide-binding domain-containing protein n=1 Tax=Ceratocystis lukuohia TaxID=2019550 RepID=A0ABR4MMF7_9PEZI
MRRSRTSQSSAFRALASLNNGTSQDPAALIRSFNVETNPTRPVYPSPLTASTIQDMPLDLLDRVRSFPLFNSAPEEFLVAVGQHLKPQIHTPSDHIIREGDEAKAMYWIVRGVVAVTSRDGEAVYAELKPGSFFGEISIIMNIPRTTTIVARTKCLLLSLKKEDFQVELPKFPEMEKLIRDEAQERLTILKKKRQDRLLTQHQTRHSQSGALSRDAQQTSPPNPKKRKSPSPSLVEGPSVGSALGSAQVNIRTTLKELPLFSTLPADVLHFLGLSAQPKTYPPFTDIVLQGTPGNEIYFIVRGEAEVIHDTWAADASPNARNEVDTNNSTAQGLQSAPYIAMAQRPRLRQGQYFGEVASLGLAHKRTATVKAITTVECLMIPGPALEELWRNSPPDIREQVEETAKERFNNSSDGDVVMTEVAAVDTGSAKCSLGHREKCNQSVTDQFASFMFSGSAKPMTQTPDEKSRPTPDPDPFLSVDMENLRNRRKGSIAPPTPPADSSSPALSHVKPVHPLSMDPMSITAPPVAPLHSPPPDRDEAPAKRARIQPLRRESAKQPVPDPVLEMVFVTLNIAELMRLRRVCAHWKRILTTSPKVCLRVDLSLFNRVITDQLIKDVLAPFIGQRPEYIDISNCFHMTDDGFNSLWKSCGQNVKCWKMRSVWDVSANQILEMSEHSKMMEEIDWSNCRKIGDNLLARVTGWVVPEIPPGPPGPLQRSATTGSKGKMSPQKQRQAPQQPVQRAATMSIPGTVVGCPKLKKLNLSYCKHITDRSMAHLALHASSRLESLTLTRCTTISDAGFHSWASFRFTNLTHLCLADCTYLSDNAIAALVNAAKNLTHLDLSFCCALSDTSTEVVALGLPRLKELRLAFCGSAVSDGSLGCVALHLNKLEGISVRGCVRVTGGGVESLLEGCSKLKWLDVSQCRNLEPWVRSGAISRYGHDERGGNGIPEGQEIITPPPVPEPSGPRLFVNRSRALAPRRRDREKVKFILQKGGFGLR